MIESRINRRGQTTLPKAVRETLGISGPDRVRYVICEDEVRILPVRPIGRLFGALEHDGPAVTLEDMEQAVSDGAREDMEQAVSDGAREE